MSVFLTPELQPFTGGTYFLPQDVQGRPGFTTVLKAIAKAWQLKKAAIRASGQDIMQQLADATKPTGMLSCSSSLSRNVGSSRRKSFGDSAYLDLRQCSISSLVVNELSSIIGHRPKAIDLQMQCIA